MTLAITERTQKDALFLYLTERRMIANEEDVVNHPDFWLTVGMY